MEQKETESPLPTAIATGGSEVSMLLETSEILMSKDLTLTSCLMIGFLRL